LGGNATVALPPQANAARTANMVTRNMILAIFFFIAALRPVFLFCAFFWYDGIRRDYVPKRFGGPAGILRYTTVPVSN
jgi:hypothetical protein